MLWGKATSFQVSRCPGYVWTVARGSAAEELRGEPQGCRVHGTPQKGGVPAWGCPWRGLWQPSSTRTVTDSLPTFCCESSSYWWTLLQKYQTRRCKPEYLTWSGEPAAPVPAGWQGGRSAQGRGAAAPREATKTHVSPISCWFDQLWRFWRVKLEKEKNARWCFLYCLKHLEQYNTQLTLHCYWEIKILCN